MTDFLTSTEAAQLCGVSSHTVLRWVERGQLQAYRLPGRGDCRIPIEALRQFMREHNISTAEQESGLPKRILVVEDNPAVSNLIELVLKHEGYDIAIARDGFVAGTLLQSFKPGLMTLDLRMPQMDGLAVLRFLHESPALFGGKILVVSGEDDEHLKQAVALGVHGVLLKPFRNADLVAVVGQLLGSGVHEPLCNSDTTLQKSSGA